MVHDAPERALRLVRICAAPRLYIGDACVTAAEIDQLLARAADATWRSARGIALDPEATGSLFTVPAASDELIARVTRRIHAAAGLAEAPGSTLCFRRSVAGEADPPVDVLEDAGRERIATGVLCLTGAEEGGAVHFPRAEPVPLALRTRPGQLLLWFHRLSDGREDPAAVHADMPVLRGSTTTLTACIYRPRAAPAAPSPG